MTKKQMSDQVQNWLGLQSIAAYDETAMIADLLYQGTLDVLARTKCTARCVHLHTQKNVDEYLLDHSILALVDIENGATRRGRRDQTSYFPAFTLIRSDVLRLEPPPEEDGETVQVWAVLRPQKMDEDGDSPGDEVYGAIPDEFHDAIVTYALWKAADYADDQHSADGERYRMLYEGQDGRGGRLSQIRIAVNKRGTARAPARRVRLRVTSSHDHWIG